MKCIFAILLTNKTYEKGHYCEQPFSNASHPVYDKGSYPASPTKYHIHNYPFEDLSTLSLKKNPSTSSLTSSIFTGIDSQSSSMEL